MRAETKTIEIYSAAELNLYPEIKEEVLNKYRYWSVEHDWWKHIYDAIQEENEAKASGFEVQKIYFSGFSSQGDAAMFEGRFFLNNDSELTTIAAYIKDSRIAALIKAGLVQFELTFGHYGHYYHEKSYINTLHVEMYGNRHCDNINNYFYSGELEKKICDDYEDLCRSIYRRLEKSYDYLTSDEGLIESFIAEDKEFTKDGEIYD